MLPTEEMQKKNKYNCGVCNSSWECFVFDEFSTPFSICFYCYLDVESIIKKHPPVQGTCNLCDTAKEVYDIPISNNVRTSMQLCKECFVKIKGLMEKK